MYANGDRMMSAVNQRQNASATGGASKRSARAITQLPAQNSTATANNKYGKYGERRNEEATELPVSHGAAE